MRHASTTGTAAYRDRFKDRLHPSHFRLYNDLWFPSIGMAVCPATRIDGEEDRAYTDAIIEAFTAGCNLVDAASSSRRPGVEQIVGRALASLFAGGYASREEILVAARGGRVRVEGDPATSSGDYARARLVDAGVAASDEFAQGWNHCMAPRYLRMQLRQTLTDMGVGALDVFYVEVPEVHRTERGPEVFEGRLRAAFAELESQVRAERLAHYGITTLDGFRVPPGDPAYLSLARVVELARDAGGEGHHFRYVQAPYNLAMREIAEFKNQIVRGRVLTVLQAGQELGVSIMGNSPLWRGQLASHTPEHLRGFFAESRTDAQIALQYSRSAPGLTCALVHMSNREHIRENLELATRRLAGQDQMRILAVV